MRETPANLSGFKGQRVVVTGDTGFKGSWLAYWLHQLGADVLGLGLPVESSRHHYALLGLGRHVRHLDVDIRDGERVVALIQEFQPSFLFHLAAQPLVRASYTDPKRTFDVNVGGSVNVLEAVRATASLKAAIFVSTDKCYRNKEWVWGYRENDELGGSDPYSASKSAAELIFNSYYESFFRHRAGLGIASVRAGNVIGGGDWSADRIVPDCVRALAEERPIILRSPNAVRPFQHVLDPLFGYLSLAGRLSVEPAKYNGGWNFGPEAGAATTVEAVARGIALHWPGGRIEVCADRGQPHEAGVLRLAIDKARDILGWSPRWGFDRALAETATWYKEMLRGADVPALTSGQISAYLAT